MNQIMSSQSCSHPLCFRGSTVPMNVARCHVSPSRMDMNMGWPRQAKIVAPPLSFFPSPILGNAFQVDAPWSWDIHGSYPKDFVLFCFELMFLVFFKMCSCLGAICLLSVVCISFLLCVAILDLFCRGCLLLCVW